MFDVLLGLPVSSRHFCRLYVITAIFEK